MNASSKRLINDYKEIAKRPLQLISAAPLEDDLHCWHINILGAKHSPYAGCVYHCELTFPDDYPNNPPSARVLTDIPHPHVHGDRICLDLLADYQSYFSSTNNTNVGWSSAYTVKTILVQLQAFLLDLDDELVFSTEEEPCDDNQEQTDFGGDSYGEDTSESAEQHQQRPSSVEECLRRIPGAVRAAREFQCADCPHRPGNAWPPLVDPLEHGEEDESSSSAALTVTAQEEEERALEDESLVCFHSRRSYREAILGVGLRVCGNVRRAKGAEIRAGLDLVSFKSFTFQGVRSGPSSGSFNYTHWLPLYITEEHGRRAMPYCEKALSFITMGKVDRFRSAQAFEILPRLMNFFVVSLMKNDLHASEKALEGYCYLHRWLVHFSNKYPAIIDKYNNIASAFITDPSKRIKSVVPDLGQFLAMLSMDLKYTWNDVRDAYISECWDRNVLWIIKRFKHLDEHRPNIKLDLKRAEQSFESAKVGSQLSLFHFYFLEMVAHAKPINEVIAGYDANFGRPSSQARSDWQVACRKIQQVSSFQEYFAFMGIQVSRDEIIDKLRNAVGNSRRKGYHFSRKNRPRRK